MITKEKYAHRGFSFVIMLGAARTSSPAANSETGYAAWCQRGVMASV
jgi:hypothetical protein